MAASPLIEFYGVRPEEESYLKERLAGAKIDATISYHPEPIGPKNIPARSPARAISVFVDSTVDAAVIDAFPDLKFIATRSTGFDHIDLTEAARRGVTVANVPSYGDETVAEFAFGLILMLSRKLYAAADQVREKADFSLEGLRGFDLEGKTIGVVGTGKIGRHVIAMAKGFGMNIVAYDPYPDRNLAADLGFRYVAFDELLADSDIVTIHVPYTKETHHLIDAAALSKMKRSALLVNTSRGGIVDTDALVKALNEKRLAGAGLDVLEEEAALKDEAGYVAGDQVDEKAERVILEDHILMKMPNVVVTPHNAFNTDEALRRILDATVENIKAWSAGKAVNIVKTA